MLLVFFFFNQQALVLQELTRYLVFVCIVVHLSSLALTYQESCVNNEKNFQRSSWGRTHAITVSSSIQGTKTMMHIIATLCAKIGEILAQFSIICNYSPSEPKKVDVYCTHIWHFAPRLGKNLGTILDHFPLFFSGGKG